MRWPRALAIFVSLLNSSLAPRERAGPSSAHSRRARSARAGCVVVFSTLLVAAASNLPYFTRGETIFHANSLGSSTIAFLKIQYEHYRDLDFHPYHWTRLVLAGSPLHTGLSGYNVIWMLTSAVSPFEHALVAYDVLMKTIGAMGLYLLLRHFGIGSLPSVVAACLFPLNGAFAAMGQDPPFGHSQFLLPWVILGMERLVATPTGARAALLALVASILYLTAGMQFYVYAVCYLLIPVTLVRFFCLGERRFGFRSIAAIAGALTLAGGLHALMVLFDLLPQIQLLSESSRVAELGEEQWETFRRGGQITGIAVATSLLLSRRTRSVRVVGLVLALGVLAWSVSQAGRRSAYSAGWLQNYTHTVTANDFIWDLQDIHYLFTGLQIPLMLIATFAIAYGRTRELRLLPLMTVSLALAISSYGKEVPREFDRAAFAPIVGFLALTAFGCDLVERRALPRRWMLRAALASAICIDGVFVYHNRTILTDAIKFTRISTPEMAYLSTLRTTERVAGVYENEHNVWSAKHIVGRRALPRWLMPVYSGACAFSRVGVALVPLHAERYHNAAFPRYYGADPDKPVNPLLDLAGVTHIVSRNPISLGSLEKVLEGPDYLIYRNLATHPRVMLYTRVQPETDRRALRAIRQTPLETRFETAYVEGTESDSTKPLDNEDSQSVTIARGDVFRSNRGDVAIVDYRDEEVTIEADIRKTSLLVLTDTFHPNWKAYDNGKPARIVRANVMFRGIDLQPGRHTIVQRYEPPHRALVLTASMLATVIALGLAAFGRPSGAVPTVSV